MDVGIVTFHAAANYGAALQAYALQKKLEELGVRAEFVAFAANEAIKKPVTPELQARLQKYPRLVREREELAAYREKREALFADFRARRLKISRAYAENEPIDHFYDRFIVGSDQVWNPETIKGNADFFLNFAAPSQRFAYAASFGLESLPEALHDWYARQLSAFAEISVRERSGQELVKRLGKRECPVCLDPTLLLAPTDWEILAADAASDDLPRSGYVLMYLINFDVDLIRAAQKTAQDRGLALKIVTAGLQPLLGPEAWTDSGVAELDLLARHAAVIMTDSFHGLALSLLFNKEFHLGAIGLASPRAGRQAAGSKRKHDNSREVMCD